MDSRAEEIDPTFNLAWERPREYPLKYTEHCRAWYLAGRDHKVPEFPLQLTIENTTTCNLSCQKCMRKQLKMPAEYMEFRRWARLVREGVDNGMQSLKPNYRNEPTMHPKIGMMLKYAREVGVWEIIMNTNGKFSPGLVDSMAPGLTEIAFSIDATTQEVYSKVRTGGNLERTHKNVRLFLQRRRVYPDLRVRVAFVVEEENIHQVQDFIRLWKAQGVDKIVVNPCYSPGQKGLGHTAGVRWGQRADFICPQLYQRLIVTATGTVLPCCGAYDESLSLGNIFEENKKIEDFWKSQKLDNLRKLHEAHQYKDIPTCARCALSFTPLAVEK